MVTDTTQQLGAMEIPRAAYLERLSQATGLKCAF